MKAFFLGIAQIAVTAVNTFRYSKLAKALLLIVLIKILIFYGFLKGFLYPRYLKPKWESDEHRSNEVMKDLLNKPKTYIYDGLH
ncbi:MAG TPA: DUF4492 domain-containing protein [Tenuifilaceae bacterium]|nr:DUF4492 domain-containing protein [Tenuifilaceae bacterium]